MTPSLHRLRAPSSLRSFVPALLRPCAPSSLRSFVPCVSLCLMASLMLAAPDAPAYSAPAYSAPAYSAPAYSGGIVTLSGSWTPP